MPGKHPRKLLDDGTPNPAWKPRKAGPNSGKHKKKGDDGWKARARGGRNKPLNERGVFVAWDGEGVDTDNSVNGTREHIYTLLACRNMEGQGAVLGDGTRRLSSMELLQFICLQAKQHGKRAIHVSFSFAYDVIHILRDFLPEQVKRAMADSQTTFGKHGPFFVKYHPKRLLHIIMVRDEDAPTYTDDKGVRHFDTAVSVRIWDCFGFFQKGLAPALEDWNVVTSEELAIVERGKADRDQFAAWSLDDIVAYNDMELIALLRMMQSLRESTRALGLSLARWDGAGATAAALYRKELGKNFFRSIETPEHVDVAAHYAYFGGRVETVRYGHHKAPIWRHDINSAYPAAIAELPDLRYGEWHNGSDYSAMREPFSLVLLRWDIKTQHLIYPFAYRNPDGTVCFPRKGYAWIWAIELHRALACGAIKLDEFYIEQVYTWYDGGMPSPFAFVKGYYAERQKLKQAIKRGDAEDARGKSLVIKLGLNSIYGKLAQKIGYNRETGQRPPFYNACYAGFVTASIRSQLFTTAFPYRHAVISMATDGIFSTERIPVQESSQLGEWEVDSFDGIVHVQSGVYWLLDGDEWVEYSRGIEKLRTQEGIQQRVSYVLSAWKARKPHVSFMTRRLVGLRNSLISRELWPVRGYWRTEQRDIALFGGGIKRTDIPAYGKPTPHLGLVKTDAYSPVADDGELSAICATPWEYSPDDLLVDREEWEP